MYNYSNKNDVINAYFKLFGLINEEYNIKPEEENDYNIDQLLDEYNDYMSLYMEFGDIEYKERAESAISKLRMV